LVIASITILGGCDGGKARETSGPVVLKGAGATAPYLAYAKWIADFKKDVPTVDVQYRPTGSGDGIQQLEAGSVDFAASDIPLDDSEMKKMKVKPFHFPTLIGAIVPVYNLPGLSKDLQFTGDALAGIFSGKIKTWNDPILVKANPDVTLPTKPIALVHRSDASGSTYALTEYLGQVSPVWKQNIGRGATVKWPAGESASGNEALAELVKKTPYTIGYVELNYAIEQKLAYGLVQNSSGKFRKPTLEALAAAIGSEEALLKDFRTPIANAASPEAYPICTLTWLLIPSEISDPAKQKEMKRFLRWGYDAGIKLAMSMDYGILPPKLLEAVKDQVEKIH